MKRDEKLYEKAAQLIEVVAYGDAAGLPVETWDAAKIADRFPGGITELTPTSENKYFQGEHIPGTWSDDTQLTMAVAEALIEANGFDIRTQADAHIRYYHETPKVGTRQKPRGWGGSTTNSIERIMAGVDPLEAGENGEGKGLGNGILMKLSPLVFWHDAKGVNVAQRRLEYEQITLMTHESALALATTALHGAVLSEVLRVDRITNSEFARFVLDQSTQLDEQYDTAMTAELEYLENAERMTPATILSETDGKGFLCSQTLAMAYGAFLCSRELDFADTVYTAVNLGGDTDSIASMVATMKLASEDEIIFPLDAMLLNDRPRLRNVAKSLATKLTEQ